MAMQYRLWLGAIAAAGILAGCAATDTGEVAVGADKSVAPSPAPPPPAPPPPPSVLAEAPAGALGALAMSDRAVGSERKSSVMRPEPGPMPPPGPDRPVPQPEPQAGMLTAGDYDDVLNPALYKAYLDKLLQGPLGAKDLPYVDANQRIAIAVVDRLGKPVPLAKVSLKSANGTPMFPLRTGADGMAYLYPNYDALEAGMVVSVASDGAHVLSQTLSAQRLGEGGTLSFDLSKDAAQVQQLDLLLTLDATGSMSDEMRYLQVELVAILDRLKDSNPSLDIRAGFIVYRDEGDAYVVRDVPFTEDLADFKAQLSEQSAQGGGDFPEAMQDAMQTGLGFDWRDGAIKINLLVADAPPHDEDISATWDSALISRSRGIHVVPLAASGIDPTAEFLMRGMAQLTGGRYLFLTDDSGIGNPHAEPSVDCYVVTRLDGLVLRVLESLISGVRVEPDGKGVIRTVGDYRAGVCKLDDADAAQKQIADAS